MILATRSNIKKYAQPGLFMACRDCQTERFSAMVGDYWLTTARISSICECGGQMGLFVAVTRWVTPKVPKGIK